jgi:hypothetical protein
MEGNSHVCVIEESIMPYRLSAAFRTAATNSGVAHYRLAARGNLSPARFSELWNHVSFGRITQQRVISIGATLGLSADACTDAIDDGLIISLPERAR